MSASWCLAARSASRDVQPTLALAGPVALAEVGWVAMGVVDAVFLGRLGPEALGASGLGGTLFLTVAAFGMGMLLGLDTLVSQAFGAGNRRDARRTLVQGVYLALLLTAPLAWLVSVGVPWLDALGVPPGLVRETVVYTRAAAWGLGPLLVFTAFRRYLQATGRVGVFMFVMLTANLVNLAADWSLIFGRSGAPRLGVGGSGYATAITYAYMAAVVAAYTAWLEWDALVTAVPRPSLSRLGALVALGCPAAVQTTLDAGVFAAAATLAGRLGPASLAAYQIVQTVAGLSAVTSVGLATAAAVRVGHARGRRDRPAAARAGWTAIALAAGVMAAAGAVFFGAPGVVVGAFSRDPQVVAAGVTLLRVAASLQVFDGLQAAATGALRGAGDTRRPMLVSLLSQWGLGLPVGYVLAFPAGLGVHGLWTGLALGMAAAGLILGRVWQTTARGQVSAP